MLALLVSPAMGIAVSNGWFGMNEADGPNGAGLLWARKGARPVAVGPNQHQQDSPAFLCYQHTCPYLWTNLKVLRDRAGATARTCRSGLLFLEVCCLTQAGERQKGSCTQHREVRRSMQQGNELKDRQSDNFRCRGAEISTRSRSHPDEELQVLS